MTALTIAYCAMALLVAQTMPAAQGVGTDDQQYFEAHGHGNMVAAESLTYEEVPVQNSAPPAGSGNAVVGSSGAPAVSAASP